MELREISSHRLAAFCRLQQIELGLTVKNWAKSLRKCSIFFSLESNSSDVRLLIAIKAQQNRSKKTANKMCLQDLFFIVIIIPFKRACSCSRRMCMPMPVHYAYYSDDLLLDYTIQTAKDYPCWVRREHSNHCAKYLEMPIFPILNSIHFHYMSLTRSQSIKDMYSLLPSYS